MNKKIKFFSVFIILILFSLFGCDLITGNSEDELTTQKTVIANNVEFSLSIGKNIYSFTDSLRIEFIVKNIDSVTKKFNFNNMQQLGFKLTDESGNVNLSYPWIVSPALSRLTLEPKKLKEYSITVSFKDFNGNYIDSGKYTLSVYLLNNNSPEVSLIIKVI